MFLSRMRLDLSSRRTMMALASPNIFHGAVEGAFAESSSDRSGRRKLWRIDHLNGERYLLLLSEVEPDMTDAVQQFGYPEDGWETKDYSTLLARVVEGSQWRFRLTANPTISKISKDRSERGRLHAHITVEHQKNWLANRAVKHGFQLNIDSFDVVHSRWERFSKRGRGSVVTLLSATFEGSLMVLDTDLFRAALIGGIGRGKAYGMGMLTIIPYALGSNLHEQ